MTCLEESVVSEVASGSASPEDVQRALEHTKDCVSCRKLLDQAQAAATSLPSAEGADSHLDATVDNEGQVVFPDDADVIPTMTPIGPYLVLEQLGMGAMSRVYAAH